jgi:hypothetical protein
LSVLLAVVPVTLVLAAILPRVNTVAVLTIV